MFIMYDSTDLTQVPAGPHAVGCYRNGDYANEQQARELFPHAYILPISVRGYIPCPCYDIEAGDYTPEQATALWHAANEAGVWRPCFYASLDNWPAVEGDLHAGGITRQAYRKWSAHYDNTLAFDSDEDAKQFTDRALGRNLDESICRTGFFPPAPKPPAPDYYDQAFNRAFDEAYVLGLDYQSPRGRAGLAAGLAAGLKAGEAVGR